jgi:hypothetical protein
MRSTIVVVIACLLCAELVACTSTGGRRYRPRTRVHYGVGYGAGPYWGWNRPVIVVPPGGVGPDIDYPIAVPLPEPPPDIGMPDMGDMDMGDMDMGGFDY